MLPQTLITQVNLKARDACPQAAITYTQTACMQQLSARKMAAKTPGGVCVANHMAHACVASPAG